MIELALPFPPSVNHYWRTPTKGKLAGRHLISAKGRQYRIDAMQAIARQWQGEALDGRLAVKVVLIPPDRRQRDIDNYFKGLLDAITHSKLWQDDGQIDQLTIIRGEQAKGGGCLVEIVEIAEAA